MLANKILQVSAHAGKIILENGGEVYRVEETITRICHSFKAITGESFVTPTGIMISIIDETGQTYSLIKRITHRGVNLDKIDKVNDVSRKFSEKKVTLEEFDKALYEIERQRDYKDTTVILFSAIGAAAFAILFKGTIKDFFCAFITGLMIKYISIILNNIKINDFFINIIGGAIAASFGYSFKALGIGDNMDIIIISSIMLLVPGLIITNAIRDTIAGDLVSGISRILEAFFIALAIAAGTGLVFKLLFIFGGIQL